MNSCAHNHRNVFSFIAEFLLRLHGPPYQSAFIVQICGRAKKIENKIWMNVNWIRKGSEISEAHKSTFGVELHDDAPTKREKFFLSSWRAAMQGMCEKFSDIKKCRNAYTASESFGKNSEIESSSSLIKRISRSVTFSICFFSSDTNERALRSKFKRQTWKFDALGRRHCYAISTVRSTIYCYMLDNYTHSDKSEDELWILRGEFQVLWGCRILCVMRA